LVYCSALVFTLQNKTHAYAMADRPACKPSLWYGIGDIFVTVSLLCHVLVCGSIANSIAEKQSAMFTLHGVHLQSLKRAIESAAAAASDLQQKGLPGGDTKDPTAISKGVPGGLRSGGRTTLGIRNLSRAAANVRTAAATAQGGQLQDERERSDVAELIETAKTVVDFQNTASPAEILGVRMEMSLLYTMMSVVGAIAYALAQALAETSKD
jgi:hypothetical protein